MAVNKTYLYSYLLCEFLGNVFIEITHKPTDVIPTLAVNRIGFFQADEFTVTKPIAGVIQ
jgi:hypothetical protein